MSSNTGTRCQIELQKFRILTPETFLSLFRDPNIVGYIRLHLATG